MHAPSDEKTEERIMKRLCDIPFVIGNLDLLEARFWKRIPKYVKPVNKYERKSNKSKGPGAKRVAKRKLNKLQHEKFRVESTLKWYGEQLKRRMKQDLECFPKPRDIHPLDRQIIEFSISSHEKNISFDKRMPLYRKKLRSAQRLAGKINGIINNAKMKGLADATTFPDVSSVLRQGKLELRNLLTQDAGNEWKELCDMAIFLRGLPVLDLDLSTIAMVGAPNVGKSSLVRALSSGKPEVNHYPFTTRGILIGHLKIPTDRRNLHLGSQIGQHLQVIDTPGVLNRPYETRNNIEKLTFSVLDNTSSAILYVTDLSGFGLDVEDQLRIREEVFNTYIQHDGNDSQRLWFDVASKCDIVESHIVQEIERKIGNSFLVTSANEKIGIEELRAQLLEECVY